MVTVMKYFSYIISLFSVLLLLGCGKAEGNQKLMKQLEAKASPSVNIGGRDYRLYVPKNLPQGRKVPLLLALHGGFGNSEYFEHHLGMNKVADRKGFIVAYPNGTEGKIWVMKNKRMWNAGNCCGIAARQNVNDVDYLADVINDIKAKYPVDNKRVYLTGHSNGAMMSYRFICERPDMVAAMVSIAGQLTANSCRNASGVDILHIHGDNDVNVPYEGGSTPHSAKGVNYRSVFQTREVLEKSGAKFKLQPLPRVDHKLSSIDDALKANHSKSLAEMIAEFVIDKNKN